jgi:uncharacterized protein YdeI (YjbR/CyaY-like superfamily)
MTDMEPIFFETASDLRDWFAEHHESAPEIWVGMYKKGSGRPSVGMLEAIDEALCVGWVDSVIRKIDDVSYALRFTPRKPTSNWAPGNIKRFARLAAEGKVLPAGQAAYDRRPSPSKEADPTRP